MSMPFFVPIGHGDSSRPVPTTSILSGGKSFYLPSSVFGPVADAVMQPRWPALPKLKVIRYQHVAAPVFRTFRRGVFQCFSFFFEVFT